ncbi:MAG TPA: hypothetical protein VF589_13265 [Allosphingosinicella sp.]|jgi:hypothetical protein
MRTIVLGLMLLAGVEGAALACSCIPPGAPEQSRGFAREALQGVTAIVEAEAISDYRPGGPGEEVRVLRTLFGSAPPTIRLERSEHASSASCDLLLGKGERKVLMLTPAEGGTYRMQSLCSDYLTSERYLPILLEEAGWTSKAGERAERCGGGISAPA